MFESRVFAQSPPLGPTLVTEHAGSRVVNNTKIMNFSDCTVTASGTTATISCPGSGSGTVTSISQGTGITNTPNPIVATGTVAVDQSFSPTWTGAHIWAPTLDIQPVLIKQTTAGSPTKDIFDVTASNGTTKYLSIDKNGNLYSVNLDATTGTTFTWGGTNATGLTAGKAGVALTVPGGILATTYDKAAAGTLSIGLSPGNATAISIAASGINTTFGGAILSGGNIDMSSAAALNLGTSNATSVKLATTSTQTIIQGAQRWKRATVADVDKTTAATDDFIIAYTSISAARVVTATTGGSVAQVLMLAIVDESGSASGTNTITLTPSSGNIDGAASKVVVNTARGMWMGYCNGTNWFSMSHSAGF